MIETTLIQVTKELQVELHQQSYKVAASLGSFIWITNYWFVYHFKDVPINIKYEIGNHNVAKATFELELNRKHPKFIVDTRNHLIRLFTLNRKTWNIECENKSCVNKINRLLNVSGMTQLANDRAFEPTVTGQMNQLKISVETFFYLGFTDREDSIKILIEFNKTLINYLIKEYC